jgi:hypothetical protein
MEIGLAVIMSAAVRAEAAGRDTRGVCKDLLMVHLTG